MGVPVITLSGTAHHSRVGNSILSNLKLAELIANSPDEYVKIAVELSKNTHQLIEYRTQLRERLLKSHLTDGKQFTTNFQDLLLNVWRTHLQETSAISNIKATSE
jgi:predicted O-linked N-acetylglucosamine transferase (SPINDLY family)